MIALILAPFYVVINILFMYRIQQLLVDINPFFRCDLVRCMLWCLQTVLILSLLIGFLLPRSMPKRFFNKMGNIWLGILLNSLIVLSVQFVLVLLISVGVGDIPDGIMSVISIITIGIIVIVCAVGVWNSKRFKTTEYTISVDKKIYGMSSLRICMIADLHIGYNTSVRSISRLVKHINATKPDIVVVAGDIFDNDYDTIEDDEQMASCLRGIESRYGVYACYGNHDIDEKILAGFTFSWSESKSSDDRMDIFLENAGIRLLYDEGVLVDKGIFIYGRPDLKKAGRIGIRRTPEQIGDEIVKLLSTSEAGDASKNGLEDNLMILADHQPKELDELAEVGFDIDLCGHTHDGQTFPVNIITRMIWRNSYGYLRVGKMHNIVTSGVGVFGPAMRLGTRAEVCRIDIMFSPGD